MKKIKCLFTAFLLICANVFALEVDRSELNSAGNETTIEFINYTGPHKVIDSIEAIKGIGSSMGNAVAGKLSSSLSTPKSSKYYVIHAVDNSVKEKLDADIIFIGEDATVDHIDNLRRIISAYLKAAYGYSEKDADTLSVFITVYNAVYRGKLDIFQSKYKEIVTKNLTKDNCGLSVNYKDWPGKSQIVIPLFDVKNGGLSTVDTSVISDTKVITSMKEDDDKNIESRKGMVDIKEREADNAEAKAQTAQKTAAEEQKKLEKEKQKTAEAKKEAAEAKKTADEKQNIADKEPDNKKAQTEAKEAKNQAEQKQKAAEKQEQKLEEQKQKTEDAKQEAKEQQAAVDKKQSEALSERKEIAKDQQEIQKKEAEQANMNTNYGIILTDEKEMLSRLVKFNSANGQIVKNSPVSVIRSRTIYKSGDSYIAIAGENKGKGAVKLVTISIDTMEISAESENYIAADSVLIQDGGSFYCVTEDNGSFYLAKFGSDLSLKLKSETKVKSATPVTITDAGIVVTGSDGKLKILKKSDLKEITGK